MVEESPLYMSSRYVLMFIMAGARYANPVRTRRFRTAHNNAREQHRGPPTILVKIVTHEVSISLLLSCHLIWLYGCWSALTLQTALVNPASSGPWSIPASITEATIELRIAIARSASSLRVQPICCN